MLPFWGIDLGLLQELGDGQGVIAVSGLLHHLSQPGSDILETIFCHNMVSQPYILGVLPLVTLLRKSLFQLETWSPEICISITSGCISKPLLMLLIDRIDQGLSHAVEFFHISI